VTTRDEAQAARAGDRTVVIVPALKGAGDDARSHEAKLEEVTGLALAISLKVVHGEVVPVPRPRPATLLGQGAVDRLAEVVEANEALLVVVDAQLTPVQQRNLEKAWDCKVIDRTGLILEIFGARARTHEGRLQVELAALTYQRSRLVRSWTHLERQRGGLGFIGGPGESQIEIDRRLIDERLVRIRKELAQVRRTRGLHRESRRRVPYPVVALVGYTNAGKSTLFNRLTQAEVRAEDLLFATLDPTMRELDLPSGRKSILSDTVGFISDLPHDLVAAFHATLEEVEEADVIVHVRDVSHPDTAAQKRDVEEVLADLGLADDYEKRLIEALNKIDLLEAEQVVQIREFATTANVPTVPCSAISGKGVDALLTAIDERLAAGDELVELAVSSADGATLAWIYEHGDVRRREDDAEAEEVWLQVALSPSDRARLERRIDRPVAAVER
jgi:GTP-binding protein HflX